MRCIIGLFLLFLSTNSVQHLKKNGAAKVFRSFKEAFGKIYKGNAEMNSRFHRFWRRYNDVYNHNLGVVSFNMELNYFSDLSDNELDHFLGLGNVTEQFDAIKRSHEIPIRRKRSTIPDSVDHGLHVTPIKNQRECGTCWAFAAVASLESAYSKETGYLKSLSEQEVIDCTYELKDGDVCEDGGKIYDAYDYLKRAQHITTYSERNYVAEGRHCTSKETTNAFRNVVFDGYQSVPYADFVAAASQHVLAVAAYATDMFFYRSGVFNQCPPYYVRVNHALTLTGYTPDAWKLKNSWGSGWGENGYIRVSRDPSQFWCQITDYGYFPVLKRNGKAESDSNDIYIEQDDENIAQGQKTEQSTTYKNRLTPSRNAVDGNINGDIYGRSCSRTKRDLWTWWRVEINPDAIVKRVDIFLRTDCCQSGLDGATVHVGFSGNYTDPQCGVHRVSTATAENDMVSMHCEGDLKGQYVTIDLYKYKPEALTLCEVKVYAHNKDLEGECSGSKIRCNDGYCKHKGFC